MPDSYMNLPYVFGESASNFFTTYRVQFKMACISFVETQYKGRWHPIPIKFYMAI